MEYISMCISRNSIVHPPGVSAIWTDLTSSIFTNKNCIQQQPPTLLPDMIV